MNIIVLIGYFLIAIDEKWGNDVEQNLDVFGKNQCYT